MRFLKVVVSPFMIINFFIIISLFSCTNSLNKKELVFNGCKVFYKKKLYSGNYKLIKGENILIGKVKNGKLKQEKTFFKGNLLMKKMYSECFAGYQWFYDLNGLVLSEGAFNKNQRIGLWNNFINDSVYLIKYQ